VANEIRCKVCGAEVKDYLPDHLIEAHGMTVEQYLAANPGAPTVSDRLLERFRKEQKVSKREAPPTPNKLSVSIGGVLFPVNANVPEDACLPLPPHYRVPTKGLLGDDVQHALCLIRHKRPLYVWGLPGSGKDALFHAVSWYTRTPAIIRQVQPGTDIQSWFYSRAFNQNGTYWEEGDVLKALRDGYLTPDGQRVPYMVLITDFDRADREQVEHIRLVIDSIQGRVPGPGGKVFNLFPGTLVVATGNSSGGGDPRARVSANVIDASIMDRWKVLQFHWMDWGDEEIIVTKKFPLLFQKFPSLSGKMGRVTNKLRGEIMNGNLMAEFSHRAICHILEHAQDMLELSLEKGRKPSAQLMSWAVRVWLDGLPDEDNREQAVHILDPEFRTLPEGDTSHIGKGDLGSMIGGA
jgi:hypothetical protein